MIIICRSPLFHLILLSSEKEGLTTLYHSKMIFIFFIIALFLEVVIFLSGERTSFLLFNFTIILFLIFLNRIKIFKMILIFFYLLLLIQLFIFDTPYKYRFLELTKNQTNIFKENTNKYIFSKQYHEH